MRVLYIPTYKCRYCGQVFREGTTFDETHIDEAFVMIPRLSQWAEAHVCDNHNIGAADFIGYERVIV